MHKNREGQRSDEERHVRSFLELSGLPAIVEAFGDKPDAVLLFEGRRIGLEHRELFEEGLARNAPNLKEFEKALSNSLRQAGLGSDLTVAVQVDPGRVFFSARWRVQDLVQQLTRFSVKCSPHVTIDRPISANAHHLWRESIRGPEMVTIKRHPRPLPQGPWGFVSAPFCGPGDSSVLNAITEKEGKLPEYGADPTLPEVWLLLVTGETWTQATDSALTRWTKVKTAFARVYLLDLRTEEIQRLDEEPRSR